MLSATSIEKFRQVYLAEFGIELSAEDAATQAQQLLNLARVVLRPTPKRLLPRYKELLAQQEKLPNVS